MTVAEILNIIRDLAHDKALPDGLIYTFINETIQDIEDYGEFNFQVVQDEAVTVTAGTKTINTTYPVKKIIKIDGLTNTDAVRVNAGKIELESAPDSNLSLTITYLRKHPYFDGQAQNLLVKDDWVLIYGGTYHALIHNEDPAAPVYQMKYLNRLDKYYQENAYKLPLDDDDIFNYVDAFGV